MGRKKLFGETEAFYNGSQNLGSAINSEHSQAEGG